MLHIPSPDSNAAEMRAGWHSLTEEFPSLLRQTCVNKTPLNFGSLRQELGAWESFAHAQDGGDVLDHPNTLDEWQRLRAMLWCADHVQKTAASPSEQPAAATTEIPAAAPPEVHVCADWSLACIRLFRGEAPDGRIAVPIALADEKVQLKGGIATLVLDIFSPGTGYLTLRPEESFRILPDADFTESLNTAWRLALETAKNDGMHSNFPDVVWRVIRESPSMSRLDEKAFFESNGLRLRGEIKGRSASGAALRAFQHLLKATNPDADVFVLAQVRKDGTSTSQLRGVSGIRAKVEAIADTHQHAVIIVTEDDEAEAALAITRKKAGSHIEVRVSIPPAIEKLLDDANRLSDEDRFAEAIPILEAALGAAREAKHRAVEAKIRIRLGHALFEGSENCGAAEVHFRAALELTGETATLMRHTALHGLGDMLLWAGRLDEACAVVNASLDVANSLGKPDAVGRSLISLGLLERHLGHAEAAATHLDNAIERFRRLSLILKGESLKENAHALAVCYQNKAQLARDDGRPEQALALYTTVEELHRESGDKLNSGKIHLLAGRLHCANAEFEQGFQCFKQAMAVFVDLKNHLWMARAAAAFARLYAQHAQEDNSPNTELWEEAAKAALAANDGFEEAKAVLEHVQGILFAADVFANLVKAGLRASVQKQIHEICKSVPKEHQANAAACVSAQMDRVHSEIDERVRTDAAIGRSLREARALAEKHQLFEEQAECYLSECRLRMAKDDADGRKNILEKALGCLQKALARENIPRRKARLMGQIGALHRQLDRKSQWASWVKRVGEIFENTGDIYGLANYQLEMAGIHRSQGRLDDQIASERKALELIEGRSFNDLAAAARINLADGLRLRGERAEALSLLTEAEAICEAHRMPGLISKIAHIRSSIEEDTQAGQTAQHSLRRLLVSLHQLIKFKPEDATSYLAFWYYAWKAELMAILRSGPGVSFMVVTDDAERFMSFASRFGNLADHFAMATTTEPTIVASARTLNIPPRWRYPLTFTFVAQVRRAADTTDHDDDPLSEKNGSDAPPSVRVVGPARVMPPYMHVSVGGDGSRISVMDTPRLPAAALQLMLQRPIKELIQRRAVWFPSPRFDSKDAFLTDLRVAYERGLFPVYFDRIPSSDGATAIDAVRVTIPAPVMIPTGDKFAVGWKRALLKITRLQREDARAALFDIPATFPPGHGAEKAPEMEVHLFEFAELGRKVIRPVLLVR